MCQTSHKHAASDLTQVKELVEFHSVKISPRQKLTQVKEFARAMF